MGHTSILLLEGSSGLSFFYREALLGVGLAQQVDMVSRLDEVMGKLQQNKTYDLIIANLDEAWDEGLQLGHWACQGIVETAVLLLVPPEMPLPVFPDHCCTVLSVPSSLHLFTEQVQHLLEQTRETAEAVSISK